MRHIKKDLYFIDDEEGFSELHGNIIKTVPTNEVVIGKKMSEQFYFMVTTTKKVVLATLFKHKKTNKRLLIPIPKIPLVFMSNAYDQNKLAIETLNELNPIIDLNVKVDKEFKHSLYRFYGYRFSSIISLFATLEAYINEKIPNDFQFEYENGKFWDREDILKFVNIETKINKVIPEIFKPLTYAKQQPNKKEPLMRLKRLRDEIVHMKSMPDMNGELRNLVFGYKEHSELLQQVYKFDFDGCFSVCADFMNFYTPGYVLECDCGVIY